MRLCLFIPLLASSLCFTGCYVMPTDEDFSVVPSTNNPDYTRDSGKQNQQMPGAGF